jgi:hypothetical protein
VNEMQSLGYVVIIVNGRADNNRCGFELICRAMADIRQFLRGKLTPHSFEGKKLKQMTIIGL